MIFATTTHAWPGRCLPAGASYASARGSTAEVARRIGTVIEAEGMSVEVLLIRDVVSLVDYDAVVFGSAIHAQSWLPEATDLLRTPARELSARPVWLLSLAMSAALPNMMRKAGQASQEKHLLKTLSKTPMRGHVKIAAPGRRV